MIRNPFFYGNVVKDSHFCNRAQETEELAKDMNAGLNVLIYAPRRFGKTSLVLRAINKLNMPYIFLDLMPLIDENNFINEYFNAISKSINTPTEKIIHFFKNVLKIKPNISVSFSDAGNPNFKLDFLQKEQKNTLKEVLEIPYLYAKHHNKRIIVAFDEFQEITKLGLENTLRSTIQHHEDYVSYIFFGSKKSILQKLFFDKTRAFYKSVKHIKLGKIGKEDWQKFIQEGFSSQGKSISDGCIDTILKTSKGFPYYTQQIAYELFNNTDKKVNNDMVLQTIKSILGKEEDLFLSDFHHLSKYQKQALNLLIYSHGEKIFSKETMQEFHFTSSSLKKAIDGLLAKDIIDYEKNRYYFQDPLFELYIKTIQRLS